MDYVIRKIHGNGTEINETVQCSTFERAKALAEKKLSDPTVESVRVIETSGEAKTSLFKRGSNPSATATKAKAKAKAKPRGKTKIK